MANKLAIVLFIFFSCGESFSGNSTLELIKEHAKLLEGKQSAFIYKEFASIVDVHIDPVKKGKLDEIMDNASDWVMSIEVYDGITDVKNLSLITWDTNGLCSTYKTYLVHNGKDEEQTLDSKVSMTISNIVNRVDIIEGKYLYEPFGDSFFMLCRKEENGVRLFASNTYCPMRFLTAIEKQRKSEDRNWFLDNIVRGEGYSDRTKDALSVYDSLLFAGLLDVVFTASDPEENFLTWFRGQLCIPRNDLELIGLYDLSWKTKYLYAELPE